LPAVSAISLLQFWLIRAAPIRCSESRTQLIRRFAAAAVLAEQMESKLAKTA
jgi:hypothetical protein